ncbi:carboxymuconolactone decarboxylase [Niastella yeongjuensis]|uniref:Carboxymuconolactone decarboxylase n=1 Tax=Niastella yeongjuensis TaxID=354355 RepID=A0A1V9EPQ7_9BACT|nr:carboxymuconolactone decarboxylase family protein [Niastella yeongjuensis]OQP47924.1 carboxymuconolactone decarboxylase [Niastella yeongjuensis]SEP48011.1 alkylhydroperoxidase AhpD family core domain-containing protein [Niastella yeongjuensis]
MKQVVNIYENGQRGLKALNTLGAYCHKSSVELSLQNLIYYRVSQLNGCAFCLDMHSKDLLAQGENVQRLLVLDAWRETTFYTERERAALAWAEALTKLNGHIDEAVHNETLQHFTEEEMIDLTLAIIAINGYNRVNVAFMQPAVVGTYTPGQFASL